MRYICLPILALALHAQDFGTVGYDAHRTSWIRGDAKINPTSMKKPGAFQFLWKVKLPATGLTAAPLLNFYIGYRGFRALSWVGTSTDKVYAFDTDLGHIEWQRPLSGAPQPCGMTANLARPVLSNFPNLGGGRGGGGRANFAKSAVGEPNEGAVTVADAERRNAAAAAAAARPPAPPAGGRGPAMPSVFAPHREFVYALTSDGALHALNISNGEEFDPAIPFVPVNHKSTGLIVSGNVAYVASGACNQSPDTLWALDIPTKTVASWKGAIAGNTGPAIGPDGTVYVTTTAGEIAALESKTLKLKDVYKAQTGFATSPLIFQHKDATMIAAATKDGRIHLIDAAKLAGPAIQSAPVTGAATLATWQDASGARYILANLTAFKFTGDALEQVWSRSLGSSVSPLIVNGVVFTATREPAVLHAFDAATGAPVWDSGKTITGKIDTSGLSAGGGQLYLGTQDGTFYAFGFPIEH
jgi:outer membrane protein assembly factor BamB